MRKWFRFIKNVFVASIFVVQVVTIQSCTKTTANRSPEISSVSVVPATMYAGGMAKVKVESSDPDKDKLTYAYEVDLGTIEGNGLTAFWNAPGPNSSAKATIIVTDGNGGEVRAEAFLSTQGIATQISGIIQIPSNLSGNLLYSKVSIYSDLASWQNNTPLQFVDVGDEGTGVVFNMVGVAPGSYFIDIWKDVDNNGKWSYGDYAGWYGSGTLSEPVLDRISVVAGQTTICKITNVFVVSY